MNSECIFCNYLKESQIIVESESFRLLFDIDPVQEGHLLLISKKHYMNIMEIPNEILYELINVEKKVVTILNKFLNLKNISIVQNNGQIMDEGTHFHVHMIPRYEEDYFWENQSVKQYPLNTSIVEDIIKNIGIEI